jgi:hypothetical protein
VTKWIVVFINKVFQIEESAEGVKERGSERAIKIIGVYTGYKYKTYNLERLDHLACRFNCRNYFLLHS